VSSSQPKVAKGELVFTSFLLVLALVVLWDSFNLVEVGINVIVGPKAFAIFVGFLLLGLSLLQILSVLRGNRGEPEGIEGGQFVARSNWKAFGIVVVSILYHILTIELLGFIAATIPLFVGIAFALGERRWIRSTIIGTIIALVTFFGFTAGLKLDLPVGFEFLRETPVVQVDDDGVVIEEELEEETW